MAKRDYYEILGVDRKATPQAIKSAYRKLALKYHPDKNAGDKQAEERFKEAAEAYSVLGDSGKRERYDRFGHAAAGAGGFGGFDPGTFADFSDIFGDFFGGFGDIFGGPRQRRNRPQRGTDLRYDLTIGFDEAVFGAKTKIKIPREEICQECNGSGADPQHGLIPCPTCRGQGQVRYQQGFFTISGTCSHCHGRGRIVQRPCSTCRGQGRVRKEKVLEIRIPAGVEDGSRLRIAGEGEAGVNSGPAGDLYVVVSIAPHPVFKRQDSNLYCEVPVSFAQAALGDEISVPTLEGEEKLRIAEGTQTGTVFQLRGRGVASLSGRGRGDLFVSVTVITPTNLTREQRELLLRFAELSGEEDQNRGLFDKVKEMFG